jgi:hypothetical protein
MSNYLEVSGVNLSSYISKMTIDDEPVWNDNAGRALDAGFVGRIIARKWKINLATKPLHQKESAIIHSSLKVGDFIKVKFIPPTSENDELIERIFYVSPSSNSVYSYVNGIVRYESMSFNLIEK